ncbi:MAG: class I SAM-dependent methyltransferase [Planctomycetota bacterium]
MPVFFAKFNKWLRHEQRAMKYVSGRVLDVGVGAGRCALYLQKRGHRVVGIDNSPLAVKTAKARGVRDARVMPLDRVGPRLGKFGTVLMLGNNFGLFESPRKAQCLLKRLHVVTTPNARIIAESCDVYKVKEPRHVAYHKLNQARGRMAGALRLRVRYRTFCTPWFDYLNVSQTEMEQILIGTGWRVRHYLYARGPHYIAIIEKAP